MNDQQAHEMLLKNQEELKVDVKEIKSEVKKINGRVTILENNREWHHKLLNWGMSVGLVGMGVFLTLIIQWLKGQLPQ